MRHGFFFSDMCLEVFFFLYSRAFIFFCWREQFAFILFCYLLLFCFVRENNLLLFCFVGENNFIVKRWGMKKRPQKRNPFRVYWFSQGLTPIPQWCSWT